MLVSALHRVFAGFVRRTWLVTIVAVAICGIFAARAIAAFSTEVPAAPPSSPPVARPVPLPENTAAIDPRVLVERNIFCSTCAPVLGPTNQPSSYSGHPAILIAVSESTATVRVIPTEAQGAWGLDETIPGVGKITQIGWSSITVIDDAGHEKELLLVEPAAGAATPAAAEEPAGPAKKLADGSYEVERDTVRSLVASGGTNAGARVTPVLKNGVVTGLRFFSIKPGSVGAAIGLRNGDIISAIDGNAITTAQQLLDIYSKLDSLPGVELQGTRAGKPLAIKLVFR